MSNEPEITIQGLKLSQGEAMTMRIAVSYLIEEMSKKGCLGKDKLGEDIRKGYLRCSEKIQTMMLD